MNSILPDLLYRLQNRAEVDVRNNRQQTPLLLAVSQGHWTLIELLVNAGAIVNVHDEDGDTCLHLALMRQTVATEKDATPTLESVCWFRVVAVSILIN
jgi:E3 ubiquitin-protein ligase mind-bomb